MDILILLEGLAKVGLIASTAASIAWLAEIMIYHAYKPAMIQMPNLLNRQLRVLKWSLTIALFFWEAWIILDAVRVGFNWETIQVFLPIYLTVALFGIRWPFGHWATGEDRARCYI